nr:2Fe-2S iron-sulfur cluster-binding protein [Nocardia jiangxiensis]
MRGKNGAPRQSSRRTAASQEKVRRTGKCLSPPRSWCGIVAECGGSCACATCHVYLSAEYGGSFAEPTEEELELIEYLEGATGESRLSCQLVVGDDDREIHVRVADSR